MTSRNRRRRTSRSLRADDQGYVMMTVIGTMLILSIMVTLTLNWTIQATRGAEASRTTTARSRRRRRGSTTT